MKGNRYIRKEKVKLFNFFLSKCLYLLETMLTNLGIVIYTEGKKEQTLEKISST